jgi:hypothetical protein
MKKPARRSNALERKRVAGSVIQEGVTVPLFPENIARRSKRKKVSGDDQRGITCYRCTDARFIQQSRTCLAVGREAVTFVTATYPVPPSSHFQLYAPIPVPKWRGIEAAPKSLPLLLSFRSRLQRMPRYEELRNSRPCDTRARSLPSHPWQPPWRALIFDETIRRGL